GRGSGRGRSRSRTRPSSSTSAPASTGPDAKAASCGTTPRSASRGRTSRRSSPTRIAWRRRCGRGSRIRARGISGSRGSGTPVPADARVAVSVLHWGAKADTLRCLASVAASRPAPAWLFVLDNGTGSLAEAEVEHAAPGGVLLRVPENLGFAGGHNLVMRRALDAGATHVLLLNNDATVEAACLGALVRVAAAPRGAAVGAKVP